MGLPFAPEQRVSWMVELLPGLEYHALYRQIEKDLGWNSPQNLRAGRAWVSEFLDPSQDSDSWRAHLTSVVGRDLGATHFVGLSGIGDDAADLPDRPEYANRLGVFGYERETALADIIDGADKTILMIQVRSNIARPWIRGGGATVQAVSPTKSFEPFTVMQANKDFGAYAIMCDGTVRFIKTGIPDELFKAMVTFKGKDSTAGIDEWAPKATFTSTLRNKEKPTISPEAAGGCSVMSQGLGQSRCEFSMQAFGVALPPGATDVTAELPWEKSFTGQWPQKKITLGVSARHILDCPSRSAGSAAQAEVVRFMDVNGLALDSSVVDAPTLGRAGASNSAQRSRTRTARMSRSTVIWVVHGAPLRAVCFGFSRHEAGGCRQVLQNSYCPGGVNTGGAGVGDIKAWDFWYNRSLKLLISFPGEVQQLGSDTNIFLYYPKEAQGGALFTFALMPAKLAPAVDVAKGYASLEAAVKEGQFGKNPINLTKKMLGDRPAVAYDLREGDTVFSTWTVYNNEESVVLKVRKDAGYYIAEKLFFASLQLTSISRRKKKDNVEVPVSDWPSWHATSPGMPPQVECLQVECLRPGLVSYLSGLNCKPRGRAIMRPAFVVSTAI